MKILKILCLVPLLFAGLPNIAPAAEAPPPTQPPPAPSPRSNVAILVFDGVQIIDYSGPYEVFGQAGFNTFTVSATPGPLTTAFGQKIMPSHTLADTPPLDVLVIPGGDVDGQVANPAVIAWIREREPSVKHILTVCNGAFILARTGLLDGLTATTFYDLIPDLKKAAPKTRIVSDQRFVDNGKIITTAGLSSGIDGALHVVEILRSKGRAQQVALNMEYQWRPDSGFARAALADHPLRQLFGRRLRLEIPGAGETLLLSTEGTADSWEAKWDIKSDQPLAELQAALDRYLTETGKWTPRAPAAGGARGWTFQDEDKRAWNATVDLRPAENRPAGSIGSVGPYRLAIRLERSKA